MNAEVRAVEVHRLYRARSGRLVHPGGRRWPVAGAVAGWRPDAGEWKAASIRLCVLARESLHCETEAPGLACDREYRTSAHVAYLAFGCPDLYAESLAATVGLPVDLGGPFELDATERVVSIVRAALDEWHVEEVERGHYRAGKRAFLQREMKRIKQTARNKAAREHEERSCGDLAALFEWRG